MLSAVGGGPSAQIPHIIPQPLPSSPAHHPPPLNLKGFTVSPGSHFRISRSSENLEILKRQPGGHQVGSWSSPHTQGPCLPGRGVNSWLPVSGIDFPGPVLLLLLLRLSCMSCRWRRQWAADMNKIRSALSSYCYCCGCINMRAVEVSSHISLSRPLFDSSSSGSSGRNAMGESSSSSSSSNAASEAGGREGLMGHVYQQLFKELLQVGYVPDFGFFLHRL